MNTLASVTSQADTSALLAATGSLNVIGFIFYVVFVVALFKVFTKAGYAGWLAIIPIVNIVILVRIAGFSGWFALLFLVPIVNIVFYIIVAIRVGRGFGKDTVFSIFLLWLVAIVGYLIIGFGSAEYDESRVTE